MHILRRLVATAWFLGLTASAAAQPQGIISAEVLIPPDYQALAGPEASGQSYVDPVFGTVVMRMTDSGRWAPNGNGGEIANSEVAVSKLKCNRGSKNEPRKLL